VGRELEPRRIGPGEAGARASTGARLTAEFARHHSLRDILYPVAANPLYSTAFSGVPSSSSFWNTIIRMGASASHHRVCIAFGERCSWLLTRQPSSVTRSIMQCRQLLPFPNVPMPMLENLPLLIACIVPASLASSDELRLQPGSCGTDPENQQKAAAWQPHQGSKCFALWRSSLQ